VLVGAVMRIVWCGELLQYVLMHYSIFKCAAMCCNVLQCYLCIYVHIYIYV